MFLLRHLMSKNDQVQKLGRNLIPHNCFVVGKRELWSHKLTI